MKKLTYIILAICVMMAVGCPSDSEMTDSISEAEAAVESHNTYTVTFDPNGGDGRAFSQSFRGGRMQPLMRCSFKRTGWTFSGGWAVEPNGEKVYRNNEQVILTKDLRLYAVWTAHKYTIKFDANGGAGDMEDLSMTYDVTKHLSPNEFTSAGYGFTGWNTASDGSGTSYANGAGISNLTAADNDVVTLYAQWAAGWVDYTVKRYFQTVDGAAYAQDTANYPNLTNSGITDTETAETAVPITGFTAQPITQQTIAGDGSTVVNIYYNRDWITYTFSANGGKWSDSTTADKDVSGYYGAAVSVPVPEKTGYHYTWDSTVPTEFDDNDGAEFTAQWSQNYYAIIFDGNGADSGTMGNQDMYYDDPYWLDYNQFTKSGYTFVRWCDSRTGVGKSYADGEFVRNLTADPDGEVTLYAIWKNDNNYVDEITGNIVINGTEYSKTGMQQVLSSETNIICDQPNGVDYYKVGVFPASRGSVTIEPYSIGKYPVTQQLFTTVIGINPSYFTASRVALGTSGLISETNVLLRPVDSVNWYDAITFCNKLSLLMGKIPCYSVKVNGEEIDWANYDYSLIPTSNDTNWDYATCNWSVNGYRLPTECEWECAARGGTYSIGTPWNYTYSGSNTVGNVAWYSSNSNNHTWEVGLKDPNSLGLYDMSGNVYEHCWDYCNEVMPNSETPVTGPAESIHDHFARCRRGGCYSTDDACKNAYTGGLNPYYRDQIRGFRIAWTVSE